MVDIEKAFLIISAEKRDRDVLHFLWVDNIDEDKIKINCCNLQESSFGVCLTIPVEFNNQISIRVHIQDWLRS